MQPENSDKQFFQSTPERNAISGCILHQLVLIVSTAQVKSPNLLVEIGKEAPKFETSVFRCSLKFFPDKCTLVGSIYLWNK